MFVISSTRNRPLGAMRISQLATRVNRLCRTGPILEINDKNCSLSIVLTAMDQKQQKS